MYPHERSLVEQYEGQPFVIIGVNSDRERERPRKLAEEGTVRWRSFWNGGGTSGPISTQWNVQGWPTIYLIDREGIIRYKNTRGPRLDKAIAELVDEALAGQTEIHAAADDATGST